MGEFHIGTDVVLGSLLAVVMWFVREKAKRYDKHLEECEETPKKLLLEKLDNLCERMDEVLKRHERLEDKVDDILLAKAKRTS